MRLDLVVALDSLGVGGRVCSIVLGRARHLLILTVLLGLRSLSLTAGSASDGSVARTSRAAHRRTVALLDIVVCHTASLGLLGELVVRRVRVARDDVPGVEETR